MPNIYNSSIVVLGGGSGETDGYKIRYFDVDGTILKTEYVKEGGKLTPPDNPTYDSEYLSFYEWNYDINNYIVERDTDIGATYRTKTGDTYLFIKLTENIGLTIPSLKINGATSIDWGDGTINTDLTHKYADYGEYVIKISGMTSITNYLFGNTSNYYLYCLQKFYFGNSVTYIASNAFSLCRSLTNVSIPNGITNIGTNIFNNCYALTGTTIPNGVTSIGNNMFGGCYSLKNIAIPNSVTDIGKGAFQACYSLANIAIPNNVSRIWDSVFKNCYSLTSIIIPNSVTDIGNGAFSFCYSLKNVSIPNNVTNMTYDMFYNCYSLTSIIIPNSVTDIGSSVFYNCYSLKNIIIPNNVTSISSSVFYNCTSIINYILNCNSVPTLSNTNTFYPINPSATIWVKDELVDAYKSADNWSTYASYIKPLSQYNAD